MTVNKTSLMFGLGAALAGVLAFSFGHKLIDANQDATEVIVTVFSIMAGFLIAIMSLLGDQSVLPGTWRIAATRRESIKAKLVRQKWLFYLYLLTLSIIFVASLIGAHNPTVVDWLERTYFGLAVAAFILSFRLPSTLMAVQMERYDAVVGSRKANSAKIEI